MLANSVSSIPLNFAKNAVVIATFLGSLTVPRSGCGAKNGLSVSVRHLSNGTILATSKTERAFLNVSGPAKD